jgi:general secretion pathway protein N
VLKKILLFSMLGVASYLSFLIATFPVSLVWANVSDQLPLKQLQINVKAVSGSIWKGEAFIASRGIEGVLAWDVFVPGFFTGKLPVKLRIKSNIGSFQTMARFALNGAELMDTRGNINLPGLNPLLKRDRLTLAGDIKVENLTLAFYDGVISTANGRFTWSGGDVKYPAGREVHGGQFPPVVAVISQKADVTRLSVRDNQSTVDLLEGELDAFGMGTLKVKRRLLDLANEPWPKNSSESDVVFKVRRKVL